MVYNFSRVCMYVRMSDGNFKNLDVKFKFAHLVYLQEIRVKFAYEGNRVKVKVTGTKKWKILIPAM